MPNENYHTLSGFLLEWPELKKVDRSHLTVSKRLSFKHELNVQGWEEYELATTEPLCGEEQLATTFKYPVTCRRSGSRVLVLSVGRRVVEHLIESELREIQSPLCRVSILVDKFAKAITAHPSTYTLSFIHARVPAFGATLRSASFYGDDLAEASLFRDNLHLLTCFTCGVKCAGGGTEIARVGNDGGVSFGLGPGKLGDVEKFLGFLKSEEYLETLPGIIF